MARHIAEMDVEQVHVQITGETRVVVSWASRVGTVSDLEIEERKAGYNASWDTVPGTLRTVSPAVTNYSIQCGNLSSNRCNVTSTYTSPALLHADLAVRPAVWYRYRIGGGGWRHFRSLPEVGSNVRVAVVGDLGQTPASAQTCRSLRRAHLEHSFDAAILVGDLSYADGNATRWDTFMQMFDVEGCSDVPWVAVPGNHEIEPDELSRLPFTPFRARWRTPEVAPGEVDAFTSDVLDWTHFDMPDLRYDFGGSFFSVRIGQMHLVVLNPYTWSGESSNQLQWLRAELTRVDRKRTPFLAVAVHAPWYHSNAKHELGREVASAKLQVVAEPLLIEAKVDVVFSGHVHAYERSQLIRGVEHVVVGHGGNFEGLAEDWMFSSRSAFRSSDHHGWGEMSLTDGYSWRARRSSDDTVVDSVDRFPSARLELLQPPHRWDVRTGVIGFFLGIICTLLTLYATRRYHRRKRMDLTPAPRLPPKNDEEASCYGHREGQGSN